jgi:thioredoxin reductase (NADPH)
MRPVILALDDHPVGLGLVCGELTKRYGDDYDVVCRDSPHAGLRELEAWRAAGREVALVLAEQRLRETTGIDFLVAAHRLHPAAKRGVLVTYADRSNEEIVNAGALGRIDYYVPKPTDTPSEDFHRIVEEFLYGWTRAHRRESHGVTIIDDRWSARAHELRDVLDRNGIRTTFLTSDSQAGRRLLRQTERNEGGRPLVILEDGRLLEDPSNGELADALGARRRPEARSWDLAIIGAGPAGLAAAVYGASEGLATVVIEREALGGQAGTSSQIRNYVGFPTGISGGELAARAAEQAWQFGAQFAFTNEAASLDAYGNGQIVTLHDGWSFHARATVVATGVTYRRLEAPGIDAFSGAGVFYGGVASEALALRGQAVAVAGGANSAGQAVLHLAKYADIVTLIARRPLRETMSAYLLRSIEDTDNVQVLGGAEVAAAEGDGHLEAIVVRERGSWATRSIPVAALFVSIGAVPQTGWLPPDIARDEQGYILTGADAAAAAGRTWRLARPPLMLETSLPGVLAAGDVRAGSVKRVAAAVGEGAAAVRFCQQLLD